MPPRRPDDAALRVRLKALASERRRFGYRRLHILLRREGMALNHKKLFRIYREERLSARRPQARTGHAGTDGGRALVVVDDLIRECLALVVDTSLSGNRVARELAGSSLPAAGH